MRSVLNRCALAGAFVAVVGFTQAFAAEPQANPNQPGMNPPAATQPGATQQTMPQRHQANMETTDKMEHGTATHVLRSTKIVGANVQNPNGEKIGSIDDIVIDADNGKVEYAALAVGGVLGIGEKLYAIPFHQFKIAHDSSNNPYFVLDVSKDRFKNAPGFDKSNWPDFANPQWRNQVDTYYQHTSNERSTGQQTAASRR